MQVTIQSFWKPVSDQMLDNCLFYIETTMGKVYSPLKFLFQNFYTGATISEEKLLATLISYHLNEENQELYTTLITRLITHTPQYIFDEFIKNGETSEFIPNLQREND